MKCTVFARLGYKLKNARNLRDIGIRMKPKDFGVI